jgi:hypothetical protein
MKKIFLLLMALVAFGIGANAQKLSGDELRKLYEKNPRAVKVYQDRILELENKINKAEENIEWIKTERAWDAGDNEGNAAGVKFARKIEKQKAIITQAKKDINSANKYYRRMANE